MKHKLPKILLAGAAVAAIIGFTVSYFKDTEVSTGNKLVAGKFNLQIDSTCTYNGQPTTSCTWTKKDLAGELFFNLPDVKPGDYGEDTISLHVINNDAWVCAEVANLTSDDNGCDKPESDIDATCGPNQGDLKENLLFTVWKDTDCDNILDPFVPGTPGTNGHCEGEFFNPCEYYFDDQVGCENEGQIYGCLWNGDFCDGSAVSCDDYHTEEECNRPEPGCYWTPGTPGTPGTPAEQVLVTDKPAQGGYWAIADSTTQSGPLPGNQTSCLGVSWTVPLATSNIIQSDSLIGDVIFKAVQSRHMDNFKCSDLYTEVCDDGKDNDYDGEIDEGCPVCGNGIVEPAIGETCDDGNIISDDGCQSICNVEDGYQCIGSPSVCTLLCIPDPELCDGLDNDCDGEIDENAIDMPTWYPDFDSDGYGYDIKPFQACYPPPGWIENGQDCDDNAATIHPGAPETPGDGIDQDCDGADAITCYLDSDMDGYGSPLTVVAPDGSCDTAQGESARNNDCNDSNAAISPAGTDVPGNDWDENCSGIIACYVDADNDTYGVKPGGESFYNATGGISITLNTCASSNTDNWDDTFNDCNDANPAINPAATEIPFNGIDENCDGKDQ